MCRAAAHWQSFPIAASRHVMRFSVCLDRTYRTFRSAGSAGNASILSDLILLCTFRNCLYRTCVLASTATDASICDFICHENSPPCSNPQNERCRSVLSKNLPFQGTRANFSVDLCHGKARKPQQYGMLYVLQGFRTRSWGKDAQKLPWHLAQTGSKSNIAQSAFDTQALRCSASIIPDPFTNCKGFSKDFSVQKVQFLPFLSVRYCLFLDMLQRLAKDGRNVGICEGIINRLTVPAACYKA